MAPKCVLADVDALGELVGPAIGELVDEIFAGIGVQPRALGKESLKDNAPPCARFCWRFAPRNALDLRVGNSGGQDRLSLP